MNANTFKALVKRHPQKKELVKHKIELLFNKAKEIFKKDRAKANSLVKKARGLSMKYKVRIPTKLKRQFCKHCYSYLMPSVNARIRTKEGKLIIYCLHCKKFTRIPYK
jgi:ribonuclease P protein subunit RPR2